ncbi:MAG: hypothetical protein U0V74_14870, partial [Chitinophagales bacterium]
IHVTHSGIILNSHMNLSLFQVKDNEITVLYGVGGIAFHPAIQVANSSVFSPSTTNGIVRDNKITLAENASHGIQLLSSRGFIVWENDVECTYPTSNRHGIDLDGGSQNWVWENTINGISATSANGLYTYSPAGIHGRMCGQSMYTCNNVSFLNTGLFYEGANNTLLLYSNEMVQHNRGLLIQNGPIGAQNNTLNRWVSPGTNFSVYGAQIISTPPAASSFLYNSSINSYYLPPSINVSGWFTPSATVNSDFCTTLDLVTAKALIHPVATNSDYRIAAGDSLSDNFVSSVLYQSRRQLYKELLENNSLLTDTTIANFFTATQASNIGRYDSLEKFIDSLYKIDSTQQYVLDSLQDIVGGLRVLIALNDSIILSDTVGRQIPTYRQLNDSLWGLIEREYLGIDSITDTINVQRYNHAASLDESVDALIAYNDIERNLKSVYHIQLRSLALDTTGLDENIQGELEALIYQCPLEGGDAVQMSRALYYLLNDTIDYSDSCTETEFELRTRRTEPKKSLTPLFGLYPNPGTDYVTVSYQNITAQNLELKLFSVNGELLDIIRLNPLSHSYTFDVRRYSNALIICRLFGDSVNLYTTRLMLIH